MPYDSYFEKGIIYVLSGIREAKSRQKQLLKYSGTLLRGSEPKTAIPNESAGRRLERSLSGRLEAENALIDAVDRGDNPSRFLLVLYYKDAGGKLVDAGDESKIDITKTCYRNMTVLFEEYIAKYDPEIARRYSYLASTFNG